MVQKGIVNSTREFIGSRQGIGEHCSAQDVGGVGDRNAQEGLLRQRAGDKTKMKERVLKGAQLGLKKERGGKEIRKLEKRRQQR